MTVLSLPARGRWVWDARDKTRAVRVAAHGQVGLLNLSMWRDETCVGTVRLRPEEVTDLVAALTNGLARLVADRAPAVPAPEAARLTALEERLAGLETRLATPPWRQAVAGAGSAAVTLADRLRRRRG
jgi:hypothetical protein